MTTQSTPARIAPYVAALCGGLLLAGCANISGLDATSEYACQAPLGVQCESVSGTYANALRNNLPSLRPQRSPSSAPSAATPPTAPPAPAAMRATSARAALAPGGVEGLAAPPIRSQPRLLRLWVKPWEDADRDLHDQGYVYVQVDSGRWLIDHAQRQIRDAYAPLRPPRRPATAAPSDDTNAPQRPPSAAAGVPAAEALRSLQAARPSLPRAQTD